MNELKFNFIKHCLLFQSKDSYNRKLGILTWFCILGIIATITFCTLVILYKYK